MTTYFVSRHPGAVEWARRRGIAAEAVAHLDITRLAPGDILLGTLPVSLAAEVCARGCRYLHLTMDTPEEARGQELNADVMEALGARLQEYKVRKIDDAK